MWAATEAPDLSVLKSMNALKELTIVTIEQTVPTQTEASPASAISAGAATELTAKTSTSALQWSCLTTAMQTQLARTLTAAFTATVTGVTGIQALAMQPTAPTLTNVQT